MRRTYVGIRLATLVSLALACAGCETSEDRAISKARACLDTADKYSAAACAQDVAGSDNPNAWLVRCSADFISQGFDATSMANAFSQLSGSSGNSTSSMMAFLVFSSQSAADTAAADCSRALQPSLAMIGSLAQTATLFANACSSSCSFDVNTDRSTGFPTAGLQSGIDALYTSDDATKNAAIGNAVITAYDQQCSVGDNKTSEACGAIVAAIGASSDPATIGYALITTLHNHPL